MGANCGALVGVDEGIGVAVGRLVFVGLLTGSEAGVFFVAAGVDVNSPSESSPSSGSGALSFSRVGVAVSSGSSFTAEISSVGKGVGVERPNS